MSDLPTLPTQLRVIRLRDNNAPRTCKGCGDPADLYAFLTAREAAEAVESLDAAELDGWPIDVFLCRECWAECPRVESAAALPGV